MADDLHTLVVGREAMACRFEVAFNAGEVAGDTELAMDALDLVDGVEERLSIYRPDSELSRINAAAAAGWVAVSADTWHLLARARELAVVTGGAFDLAAGALVRAWGFERRQGRVPEPAALEAAIAASGMRHVEFDDAARRIRFLHPGVALNPGAIGKGWALDRAVALLASRGVPSCLVHGGQSSVAARGTQGPAVGGRRGWRVGLRHPLRPGRRLATIVLRDRALGTSGSGTQFFIDRGQRIGHILDPRTGLPADGVVSATVIAESAADADALATALFVLGVAGFEAVVAAGASGAILVLSAGATTRVVLANLAADEVEVEPEPGLTIDRVDVATDVGKRP
jgi:thiamine biosynthesis lipoprotein